MPIILCPRPKKGQVLFLEFGRSLGIKVSFREGNCHREVRLIAKLKNQGEVTIISIHGSLDIEKTQPFKEACIKHFLNKKLVFNMAGASFVGSTGLKAFLDTIQTLSEESVFGLKMVGLRPEFRRILQNMDIKTLQIHDSLDAAMQSFIPVPEII